MFIMYSCMSTIISGYIYSDRLSFFTVIDYICYLLAKKKKKYSNQKCANAKFMKLRLLHNNVKY